MELLVKLERMIVQWLHEVPHLPGDVRKWLSDNVWWIAIVGAVATGVGILGLLATLFSNLSVLNSPFVSYYASTTFVALATVKTVVSLVFTALGCILLALAVTPLKEKQKKGWVLIFGSWLVSAVAVVVGAVMTLNPLSFLTDIIFGALALLVGLYLIFEIHGQFAHVEKSKGVKKNA